MFGKHTPAASCIFFESFKREGGRGERRAEFGMRGKGTEFWRLICIKAAHIKSKHTTFWHSNLANTDDLKALLQTSISLQSLLYDTLR